MLINEYKKGEGIMPHEDGDAYAHVVATVSLGAPICLEIMEKVLKDDGHEQRTAGDGAISDDSALYEVRNAERDVEKIPTRILQEPRSLLITMGPAYTDLLHGIAAVEVDERLDEKSVANWSLLSDRQVIVQAGGRSERGMRISLTYRDVLKVSKAAGKVFGTGRR